MRVIIIHHTVGLYIFIMFINKLSACILQSRCTCLAVDPSPDNVRMLSAVVISRSKWGVDRLCALVAEDQRVVDASVHLYVLQHTTECMCGLNFSDHCCCPPSYDISRATYESSCCWKIPDTRNTSVLVYCTSMILTECGEVYAWAPNSITPLSFQYVCNNM